MFFPNKVSPFLEKKSSTPSEDVLSQEPFLGTESVHIPSKHSRYSVIYLAKCIFFFSGTVLVVVAAAAIIVMAILPRDPVTEGNSPVKPDQVLECGKSPEEARARGCFFDIMHYSWTPEPCYNHTLSQKYWQLLTDLGIEFWNSSSKEHVLPIEEILASKHEFAFTSWLLHLKHCQYLLHRGIQTLAYGSWSDNISRWFST